jgi:hypothetical protein
MSNPTSNFNWQMPTNTDLVSQLPADFEVFGQAVDTSLADLKGGTTGQILAKNSNTDMDFVWSSDTGFTNPMTTTGDTIYSSSGSTPARLGIGTTGQVLTVSGGLPAWSTPAGGGKVLQVIYATYATETTNTTTTMADTGLSASITPSSTGSRIAVFVSQSIYANRNGTDAGANVDLRRNTTTIWNTAGIDATVFIGGATANTIQTKQQMSIVCVDSPATTSATTYKTRFQTNGGTARAQQNSHISSIILMEIGA